jgi:uncharacterized protein YbjT (DUF2867 family)
MSPTIAPQADAWDNHGHIYQPKQTMPTAIIAGASGLTGQALLKRLIASHQYQRIITLERRASASVSVVFDQSSIHQVLQVDFNALPAFPPCDDAYCCLGTTIKKAGSKAAFRKVDFDAVVNFATRAHEAGAKQFLVISALDAAAKSALFYNRVKGEMEEAVAAIGFDAVHIFQPSFLMGERRESRLGERLGIAAFKTISPLLVAGIRKYRPIHVDVVASAMLTAAMSGKHGVMQYESDVIQAMA